MDGYTTRLTLDGIMNYLFESVDVGVYGCLAPLKGLGRISGSPRLTRAFVLPTSMNSVLIALS